MSAAGQLKDLIAGHRYIASLKMKDCIVFQHKAKSVCNESSLKKSKSHKSGYLSSNAFTPAISFRSSCRIGNQCLQPVLINSHIMENKDYFSNGLFGFLGKEKPKKRRINKSIEIVCSKQQVKNIIFSGKGLMTLRKLKIYQHITKSVASQSYTIDHVVANKSGKSSLTHSVVKHMNSPTVSPW
jgi:hypothetical protein